MEQVSQSFPFVSVDGRSVRSTLDIWVKKLMGYLSFLFGPCLVHIYSKSKFWMLEMSLLGEWKFFSRFLSLCEACWLDAFDKLLLLALVAKQISCSSSGIQYRIGEVDIKSTSVHCKMEILLLEFTLINQRDLDMKKL